MSRCCFSSTPWSGARRQSALVCALGLVQVCIFCLCVLFLLQVAAVYRDPSVGNLINIMIVKLIVVHNEQVSAGVAACATAGQCQPCQSWSLKAGSPWKTRAVTERHLEWGGGEEAFCAFSGAIDD